MPQETSHPAPVLDYAPPRRGRVPWRRIMEIAAGCILAAIIFLQIFLGRAGYRRLADRAISRLRVGLREKIRTSAAKLKRA